MVAGGCHGSSQSLQWCVEGQHDRRPQCNRLYFRLYTHVEVIITLHIIPKGGVGGATVRSKCIVGIGKYPTRCKLPCATPRRKSCHMLTLQLAIAANYQHIGRLNKGV